MSGFSTLTTTLILGRKEINVLNKLSSNILYNEQSLCKWLVTPLNAGRNDQGSGPYSEDGDVNHYVTSIIKDHAAG